ncbi:DUF2509 family protein [[Erwinia] mediterraneensis]|uniref:DUF2509 family protein n=1 Tax=[Erwinia] mediterraneensis TaxID=2161819 RepID=UPI00102FCCDE|nr:DUF2509 family protein [[Erwinia] mediterraneensis]
MRQNGNSALGMVIMVLLMGSATLYASRQQLAQGMALLADERHYILDYHQAQSALRWGATLNWPVGVGWQCQQEKTFGWQSCLWRGEKAQALLRGQGAGRELALWHWVEESGNQLRLLPHGWIDYCPLALPELCA